MAQYIRFPAAGSNASIGLTGAPAPTSATEIAGVDGSGNLAAIIITANGLKVDVAASVLPTGAATAARQDTGNASLASIDTKLTAPLSVTGPLTDTQLRATAVPVSAASLPLPAGASTAANQATEIASLASIDTKLTSPLTVTGPLTDTQLRATAVPVSAASLPLPTGAATAANQATEIASLASIDTKLTSPLAVTGPLTDAQLRATAVPVSAAAQPGVDIGDVTVNNAAGAAAVNIQDGGNSITVDGAVASTQSGTWNITDITGTISLPTGSATAANQTTANSSLSTIATNSGQSAINTTGSGSAAAATVSTVITLTAPASAVGFILMNIDTSTTNMRWAIGRTATTTLGQQLQPGRSSDFVPCGANVSIVAESGTVTYDVQWISR